MFGILSKKNTSEKLYLSLKNECEKIKHVTVENCHMFFIFIVLGFSFGNKNNNEKTTLIDDTYFFEMMCLIYECLAIDVKNNINRFIDESGIKNEDNIEYIKSESINIVSYTKSVVCDSYVWLFGNEEEMFNIWSNRNELYSKHLNDGNTIELRKLFVDISTRSVVNNRITPYYQGLFPLPVVDGVYVKIHIDSFFKHLYPTMLGYYIDSICEFFSSRKS